VAPQGRPPGYCHSPFCGVTQSHVALFLLEKAMRDCITRRCLDVREEVNVFPFLHVWAALLLKT